MSDVLLNDASNTMPIELVRKSELKDWKAGLSENEASWVSSQKFDAKPGQVCRLPDPEGKPARIAVGWDGRETLSTLGGLPFELPAGEYHLSSPTSEVQLLGWATGAYQFLKYRRATQTPARLLIPQERNVSRLQNLERAVTLTRDLINTPTNDMLPSDLAEVAQDLAKEYEAECEVTVGDELLSRGYRTIHAVGRASADAPRLIDLQWGDITHPNVVLVGKGVCFDSGGLDLKPAAGMRLMKKDMGGAAQVLGLANLIMAEKLPINLRVLVPAVENAVSSNAFRPGDVIRSYKGLTVEIDNTDAEGRLILCDALTLASESNPQLVIDFATLTGSARSAVGAEVAAMFSNDDSVANAIYEAGQRVDDPVWRMPLHQDYNAMLNSKVADVVNSAASPYAGAITAALFLERFVNNSPWVHFDIMAFNTRHRPGRPEGGEAMGLRAVFEYLERHFSH